MICLTFDTDHMTAESMEQFFDVIEIPGDATFFLWRPFPGFDWRDHEFEPHPHYEDVRDPEKLLTDYAAEIGMAFGSENSPIGVRTHSCITSHMISLAAKNAGFKYTSMTTRIGESGIKPYREPWGVWEFPIYYMDNMDFCLSENWPELKHEPFDDDLIERALKDPGLYVFDFHPLHLALNTPNFSYYQGVKSDVVACAGNPFDHAFNGFGARSFYQELISAMRKRSLQSVALRDVQN